MSGQAAARTLKTFAIRARERAIDGVLRIDRHETLNSRPVPETSDAQPVAAELKQAVNGFKEIAFDAEQGTMDYQRLRDSEVYEQYQECAARLRNFDPGRLGSREERLAFWINLYNALIIDAVICFEVEESIREIKGLIGFFRRAAYEVGGLRYAADDIEQGVLRSNRGNPLLPGPQFAASDPRTAHVIRPLDPRIHFALNCASRSCPPVGVYDGGALEAQLEIATQSFINGGGAQVDVEEGSMRLSQIFDWYEEDFGGKEGIVDFVLQYLNEGPEKAYLAANRREIKVAYQSYDWGLNA